MSKNQSNTIDKAKLETWRTNEQTMSQKLATLGIKPRDVMFGRPRTQYRSDAPSYGLAEITATIELCAEAGTPIAQVSAMVRQRLSVAAVKDRIAATAALQRAANNEERMQSWAETQATVRQDFVH